MKVPIKKKQKAKTDKPSALGSYTASYLDKRSKSYHKIVMTAFVGLFGLVGSVYIFSSNAATESGETVKTNSNFLTENSGYAFLLLVFLALISAVTYWFLKRK
jgi:hypothetical protein